MSGSGKVDSEGALNVATSRDATDAEDTSYMQHFVEQYLTSRGYSVSSRNARVVVSVIAGCRPGPLDDEALELCIDRALDPELLRPAA